jgi:hypothetical protein
LLTGVIPSSAQAAADSLEYSLFAKQLRKRFSEEQVRSIIAKLPEGCRVFGFDIGDYSGDKKDDLVLSARGDENLKREIGVYFYLNRGERFELVKYILKKYLSEAVEIGFSIDQGICTVTQKTGEYHWQISGYRIDDFIFHQVTAWETQRLRHGGGFSGIGHETTINYSSFRSSELYYRSSDVKQLLKSEYFSFPLYPEGLRLPRSIPETIGDSSSQSIVRGSSSWFGPDDASFFISGRFDSSFVRIVLTVNDDKLLSSDSLERCDFLALCFDVSGKQKVDNTGAVRRSPDEGILSVILRMGDGASAKPKLSLDAATSIDVEKLFWKIQSSVDQSVLGTSIVELRIPAELFASCINNGSCGFSALYHDIDNADKPEWTTDISTGGLFDPDRPDTYGKLLFVQGTEQFLVVDDLRLAEFIRKMERDGVTH